MADLTWTDVRGRNGFDPPLRVAPPMVVEASNVLLYGGGLGTKRGGSTAITEGGTAPTGHNAMFAFVPGQDLTVAELWIVDGSATTKILRGNTGSSSTAITLTNLTLIDAISASPQIVSSATLNGKLYLAYKSGVNRIHVYDPGYSTTTVRRGGMGTPAAPTAANTGSGSYANTLRYYKVAFAEERAGVIIRLSELSPSVSFTPSGSGTAARVTKPSALSPVEGETHWMVFGSSDDTTYYLLSTIVVGTTTYDDSAAPSTYSTNSAEPSAGQNTPFPSVKWLATDGNRLLGFGVWETSAGDSLTPKNGRVFFGPVLDASGSPYAVNDDERINNSVALQGWIDMGRNTGAIDVGITKRPVSNVFYVFQTVGIIGLVPTESGTVPYRRISVSNAVGAWSNESIVVAEDANGSAACYFLDPIKGPYTVGGPLGLKWIGKDVKDVWATVNRDATSLPWGLWFPDRNLLAFWVPTGNSNTPNTILACDVTKLAEDDQGDVRGGWTVWSGDFAAATCGVMFSNTVAATRSRVQVPYVGLASGTHLYRYDESAQDDNGTAFKGFVTSGVLRSATKQQQILRAYLRATAQTGVTIQQSITRNFGDETNRTSTVSLTPTGSQTALLRKFEDAALQDADAFQITLGDASAVASAWQLLEWAADIKDGSAI